ncbi:hypothetical protein BpHYR1_045912 [Brachionus plicatilis]|uniref:Uncharacterized protein n=1 Tax=Brachionus plicatilis TaxID=10195 RepID=A0A3M7PNM5_BRAPC|nr:hypothetical protein BpHYR1_045912 [Brachionus plicatilis]
MGGMLFVLKNFLCFKASIIILNMLYRFETHVNCVIRDIFIQHKNQVSDQLSEVHKLMSISSFNDLVTHLHILIYVKEREFSAEKGAQ